MNRLHHIKKTLPANIMANKDYANIEFIVLDYNSSDGLEEWINENYQEDLSAGKLVFKRTNEPARFLWSHSKNMVHKVATGDIVCNVDADNFTGQGFATYLNEHFQKKPNSFLSVNYNDKINHLSDTFRRIACFKKDFEATGGYDERMRWYGYEDNDFCERFKRMGKEQCFIEEKEYLDAIQHDAADRFKNNTKVTNLKSVYIKYVSPLTSKIMFLFNDGNCLLGTIEDFNKGLGTPTINEGQWNPGTYRFSRGNKLGVHTGEKVKQYQLNKGNLIDDKSQIYYQITDEKFLKNLEVQYTIIANHQILVENLERGIIKVNI